MVTSPVTVVPIQQIFDIAQARSALRTKIVQQRWPIMFNARAAAVLTALGELILEGHDTQCVVKIEIIANAPRCGVRLHTSFQMTEETPIQWDQRKLNLRIAAADTNIHELGKKVEVTTYVWLD
jgi:hypothetical protein